MGNLGDVRGKKKGERAMERKWLAAKHGVIMHNEDSGSIHGGQMMKRLIRAETDRPNQ